MIVRIRYMFEEMAKGKFPTMLHLCLLYAMPLSAVPIWRQWIAILNAPRILRELHSGNTLHALFCPWRQ